MTSVVESSATIDDESTSNTSKRRRSSVTIANETDTDETPSKRVRSSSSTNNSTADTNNLQSMFTCLNNIVQSHRNLVREYVDLQMCDRPDLSLDEQRFVQAEEDLIEKVEKNLHDSNNVPSTPPSRNGKRQRYQSVNSASQPFDRVKHETHILKRIDELKSDGKWTNQRLAKCLEPSKRKTHWDYLLDEMRWLAEDFELERRWKQVMAKKLSLAVLKYFRDKYQAEHQQQQEESKRRRRQAQFICREVMNYWKNIHKIADYKATTRTQQLRKYQLDLHLNIIVDQTEKYSDWLVRSLRTSSRNKEESDDEETIDREEQHEPDEYALNELQELKEGQEESLDVLLRRHYGIDLSNSSSEKENNFHEEDMEQEEEDGSSDDEHSEASDDEFVADEVDDEHPTVEEPITTEKQLDDLATTAESLQPTGFTLDTTTVKIPVPFLLKHPLREYQRVGLDWLVTLHENRLNCILADEMGLGKTIQTIALLAHLACEKGVWGPHLIVVPTSVMLNWELEFKRWCPAFKILTYYGSVKERQLKRQGWTKANAFHVCITSYKLVMQDAKSFRRKKWKYLILDEAQHIKNFKSQRWQTLLNFHSQRRLLLTGTPLQNSLMELWSLMHFLMPSLFASHEEFREWFSNPLTEMIEQGQTSGNDSLIKRLHKILRPFILRRLKKDVEKQMPRKHEHVIMCPLSKRQRELYEDFIQCKSTRDMIQQGHYMSVINILMQLRKVCNHPDLFEPRPVVSPFVCRKDSIKCEIPKLVADVSLKNPYLSLNSSPNDTFFSFRIQYGLQATRDMIMNAINRGTSNDDDNDDNYTRHRIQLTADVIERYRDSSLWFQTNGPVRNLRNGSGMKRKMLTEQLFPSDDIYEEICHQREDERLSRYELLCQVNADRCQSRPLYGSDLLAQITSAMQPCHGSSRTTFGGHALCQRVHQLTTRTADYMSTTNTLRTLVKSNRDRSEEFKDLLNRFLMCTVRVLASPIDLSQFNGIRLTAKTTASLQKPLIEVLSSTDAAVLSSINEAQRPTLLQFPERRLVQYDCGKLQTLDRLLSDLKRDKHRCLIFTQMTKVLDTLEVFLNYHGHAYLRLDGTTPAFRRQLLMERFNSDAKIFVFILSTRAGGIGVNLTGADTVIFYDSDWNPTMDAQAQDRCHRIGQTKDVHIYRLISKNTIEENILKKANQKRLLGDLAIDGGSFDLNYFKKSHIRELFDQSSTIDDIVRERNEYQQQLDAGRATTAADDDLTVTQVHEALASAEDESDRQATNEFNREVTADLNEFNEADINDDQLIEKQKQQMSRVEEELRTLNNQLRPIERYVLRCVEADRNDYQTPKSSLDTYFDTKRIRKDWHLSRLKALKEQQEKQTEQDDDEMMYTYTRDNERKIWITEDGQAFEVWCGIILKYSGEGDQEFYNDDELDIGYESEAMFIEPEEYVRFPLPKALADTTNTSKSDTNILVPRSLFDRSNLLLNTQSSSLSTNTLNKSKQTLTNNNKTFPPSVPTTSTPQANIKARQLYVNNGTTTTPLPNSSNTNVIVSASAVASSRPVKLEEMFSKDNLQGLLEIDNSDWLISEDYKVLDTIQNIQQLPLSSMSFSSTANANKPQSMLPNSTLSSSPLLPSMTPSSASSSSSIVNNTTNALTQNWDFISDNVNRYSRVLRTPKQCKHRFEQVIGPREEGRVVYDLIKKKKHVIKGTVKMSDDNWQMLRTNQLFVHDNCQKLLQIYHQKFESIAQSDQQLSALIYLNKFKQIQAAQVAHHQMRGFKQSSPLQENNISIDLPLTPGDVSYQRSEREKELKQQQQQQAAQAATNNVTPQQSIPTTPTNMDAIKQQQLPSANAPLTSTINPRVRPSPSTNTSLASLSSSSSTSVSLIQTPLPSHPPAIQRTVSNNIIMATNNHPAVTPTRSQGNILSSRTGLPTSTSLNSTPPSSQSSIPTATIVPGQRSVQVLPPNNSPAHESNTIQQKQVGTVQITANEYRQVRAIPQPSQQPTMQSQTPPTNVQVRAQNFPRNQAQAPVLATLDSRSQHPPSPKSQPQQQQQSRPPSATPRPSAISQSSADYPIQAQTKSLTSSSSQSALPVAVVRPMQHPAVSNTPPVSTSPTSPLNLPSLSGTLPPNKLSGAMSTATTVTANPPQQLRTTTTFLPSATQSTPQTQAVPPQIRQLVTNANNATLQTQSATSTQRLTETAQRSPTNFQQLLASRAAALPSQVRNVRILTFTPGTNSTTGIADTTTTTSTSNNAQTPLQSASITYNRTNSSSSSIPRSTINIDQDISPDIAAQIQRLKSFNVTSADPNDSTQTPRAVLVPARTIPGSSASSTSSVGATAKIKASSLIDPATLGFTTKTSQASIVFQLPSTTTGTTGGDEQTASNSSGITRQNLMQHLSLMAPSMNQRANSPTTISNTANAVTLNRILQQYHIRTAAAAALNPSSSSAQGSSGQATNEQTASASPPTAPSSSSSSSTT